MASVQHKQVDEAGKGASKEERFLEIKTVIAKTKYLVQGL